MPKTLNTALTERAGLKREIEQASGWATAAASYQDGAEPAETAETLLDKVLGLIDVQQGLVTMINLTNATTRLTTGETLTAALGRREALRAKHKIVLELADTAAGTGRRGGYSFLRSSRSELATVAGADVARLRAMAGDLAKKIRDLDADILHAGLTTDLVDAT